MMAKEGGSSGGNTSNISNTLSSLSPSSPCAACKLLRRRCSKDCVYAPHFPADQPQKFASVHRIFGASNVNKILQDLPEQQRGDAVSSMVYEADARMRDPVYGCAGAISSLQQQVTHLQTQLAVARAETVYLQFIMEQQHQRLSSPLSTLSMVSSPDFTSTSPDSTSTSVATDPAQPPPPGLNSNSDLLA